MQAANGDLYGTTQGGGANTNGTIFRITTAGALTTLYSFSFTDGASPESGLVQGTNGDFYGTTDQGGAFVADGTIFKITPTGVLTTLHSFSGADGFQPVGGVVQAADGDLYGTTEYGGANDYGTISMITSAGLTTLHSFDGTDGWSPSAPLVQDTDGDFYGTTPFGGVVVAASSAFLLALPRS